jgi:16S rRNA (cytosine967-C5)-methyltransferase
VLAAPRRDPGDRRRDDVELLDGPEAVARVAVGEVDLASGPYVQLWPHRQGTDAMFVALVQKRA